MLPRLSRGDLDRDGWCVLAHRVGPELLGAVRSSQDRSSGGSAPDHRRLDEWRRHDAVRRLATEPAIMEALRGLFGRRPIPFQTLNFATGSQQRLHSDAVHFDSLPPDLMCGVWVALEDVGADQGPLRYVPGSHRLPPVQPTEALGSDGRFDYAAYEDLVARRTHGLAAEEFTAAAGEVFVWHPRLLHGGSPVSRRGSTRWSQVTHYFFEGAAYVTPMYSEPALGRWAMRDPLIDIATGTRVTHLIGGEPARLVYGRGGLARILGPDDPPPSPADRMASSVRVVGRSVRHAIGSVLSQR